MEGESSKSLPDIVREDVLVVLPTMQEFPSDMASSLTVFVDRLD